MATASSRAAPRAGVRWFAAPVVATAFVGGVTLTGFSTSPGPDLRVRVAPGGGTDGSADGVADLGALKGNRGDQQYDLPAGFVVRGATVLIWCRAFSALFGSAALRAS